MHPNPRIPASKIEKGHKLGEKSKDHIIHGKHSPECLPTVAKMRLFWYDVQCFWLARMNLLRLYKRGGFLEENICCVYSGLTAVLCNLSFKPQSLNADFLYHEFENLMRKWPAHFNRRNVIRGRKILDLACWALKLIQPNMQTIQTKKNVSVDRFVSQSNHL